MSKHVFAYRVILNCIGVNLKISDSIHYFLLVVPIRGMRKDFLRQDGARFDRWEWAAIITSANARFREAIFFFPGVRE